jgi:origin recognition complex subunit 3
MAGLLRPHEFTESLGNHGVPDLATKSIWELPDTSILFKRYLDSGKMINVYDWFESFKIVLDAQRLHLQELADDAISPRKRGSGKAKKPQPKTTEKDEEEWTVEVQARFVRAMHELDYLGFIKHTGRKADHLMRTVFEIDDAE